MLTHRRVNFSHRAIIYLSTRDERNNPGAWRAPRIIRHVVASIDDADVQQSWVGNYESESRSETAGQQDVRNVSPRNCLPRNVARKKTSAGRDIETRHALQTHPPTNSCDWGGKSRWLVPPNHRLVSCLPPLLNSSSSSFLFPLFLHFVEA